MQSVAELRNVILVFLGRHAWILAGTLERACHACGIDFIDANEFAVSSPDDPIHWQAATHRKFGKAIAARVKVLATDGGEPG